MADQPEGAPASREEIRAALAQRHDPDVYPLRQEIVTWLRDDKDGAKAAWLKDDAA